MYDRNDPRARLAAVAPAAALPASFAGGEYGRFYDDAPQVDDAGGKSWFIRGQNFVLVFTEATAGATFTRETQADEYVVLVPERGHDVEIRAGAEVKRVTGPALVVVPPGPSQVKAIGAGRVVRLVTARAEDLVALCPNRTSYAEHRGNIPAFQPWPAPPEGYRIRAYSLDVPPKPGRFGRIFRCTTFMVNILDPQVGPRDVTKLSPHHHDDFEQCSLALEGAFMHHLRWPWTTNLNAWRDDDHAHFASPSALVIPPPAIHTSRGLDQGTNQLVDIFSPPRIDFSLQDGWVLNAADYPDMPAE
ncbi:MAG: hypothetical protein J0H01_37205 [Rhizobiales bacterium]|nr:hypothetical protein [Hyphomicrobiales bacterium]